MRGDLHRDYSTTSARHHAIENPISVLSIEKGTIRGINHASGDNGKSFEMYAAVAKEITDWICQLESSYLTIADATKMSDVNTRVNVTSYYRVKKIILTIEMRSYMSC